MRIVPYTSQSKDAWDACVRQSRNGTFMLERAYMDYHSDRFHDCSVMFLSDKEKVVGVFPADIYGTEVRSHGGLTYGGLISVMEMSQKQVLEAFQLMADYYRSVFHATTLLYKSIPYIYYRYMASEDLYALYRMGATLVSRGVSQTVSLLQRPKLSVLRLRQLRKSQRNGLKIEEVAEKNDWNAYWCILSDVLKKRHNTLPVHSLEEIYLLHSRFPERIRLFVARESGDDTMNNGNIVAGTVLYLTDTVAHSQYIAANERGRSLGALSLLFDTLMPHPVCEGRSYFDFGISTEDNGNVFNEGLTFQKEGLGGRGVCYDTYLMKL